MSDDTKEPTIVEAKRQEGTLTVIEGGKETKEPGKKRDLTGKQLAFVAGILKGLNQSEAYRQAYDAEGMAENSVWTEASKLFSHPVVSQRITRGREAQEAQAVHSQASLRSHIQRRLLELSDGADSDQARLRALELLGKLGTVQAFVDVTATVGQDMTADEVRVALEERLKKAFAS